MTVAATKQKEMLAAISSVFIGMHAVFFALSGYQLYMERYFERAKLTEIQIVMPRATVVGALLQIATNAVAISSQARRLLFKHAMRSLFLIHLFVSLYFDSITHRSTLAAPRRSLGISHMTRPPSYRTASCSFSCSSPSRTPLWRPTWWANTTASYSRTCALCSSCCG